MPNSLERAIYLELETYLKNLNFNAQTAKMSRKKSQSDRENRMQKVGLLTILQGTIPPYRVLSRLTFRLFALLYSGFGRIKNSRGSAFKVLCTFQYHRRFFDCSQHARRDN